MTIKAGEKGGIGIFYCIACGKEVSITSTNDILPKCNNCNSVDYCRKLDYNFKNKIEDFIYKISAFYETSTEHMIILSESEKIKRDKLLKEFPIFDVEKENRRIKFTIDEKDINKFSMQKNDLNMVLVALDQMPKSYLIMLVSIFDSFIASLARVIYYDKNEILRTSKKQLEYIEIMNFKNIDEIKEYMIEREIDLIFRDSHENQIEWINKQFSIDLKSNIDCYPEFIELMERRNLFTHTDGHVNRQYLNKCKSVKYPIGKDNELKKRLAIEPKYYERTLEILYEIAIKLGIMLWRKFSDDIEVSDGVINQVCYNLICSENYNIAVKLLEFMLSPTIDKTGYSSEGIKLMLTVNLVQAYKWMGKSELMRKRLDSIDWKSKSNEYRLANLVMTEQYSEAFELMYKIGDGDNIGKRGYKEWPLFKELRKKEEFKSFYEKTFKEKYESEQELNEIDLGNISTNKVTLKVRN